MSRTKLWFWFVLLILLTACGSRTIVDETTTETGLHSSLLFDEQGMPMVAYFDKSERVVKLVRCGDEKCSSPQIVIVDDKGAVGQYPSLALDSAGNAVIGYYDMTGKSLKLAFCQDAVCSQKTYLPIADSTSEKYGEYNSMALNSQGFPVISYFDSDNENLNLAICQDAQCGNYKIVVVDDSEEVGKGSSLALTSQDIPVISYFDEENEYLKLAICRDPMCDGEPTIRFFDSGEAESGEFNSLALDGQDRPVIAYQYYNGAVEPAVGAAMVVFCNDASCSDITNVRVDDAKGETLGSHISMDLTREGHPVIAYWDNGGRQVKVVVCRDTRCSRKSMRRVRFDWGLQYISVALDSEDHIYFSAYEVRPNRKRLVLYHPRFP